MSQFKPSHVGILLGTLYGLALRVLWDIDALQDIAGIVTLSFMFIVPFVIGFIRIHFECIAKPELSYGKMITLAWQPIFVFLLVTVVTLMEGSICIAMALPAFMLSASLGGLAAGSISSAAHKRKNSNLLSVSLLPLLLAPVELNYLQSANYYQVEDSIIIDAPIEQVWQHLANVREIKESEYAFSFTQLIGVPRPIKANMSALGVGAVRTSYWQAGIEFQEVITSWQPNKKMAYDFRIDPALIPDHALDKHVKLGGDYFSPLRGAYQLSQNENGMTVLSLRTELLDKTNFGLYSRLWGELIFSDFHQSLLKLMKARSERS